MTRVIAIGTGDGEQWTGGAGIEEGDDGYLVLERLVGLRQFQI